MNTYIELENVHFFAYHGVMEQEKVVGNHFEINLCVEVDFQKAITEDEIDNTVSYADLYEVVKEEMMKPSNLIEHVAGRIMHSIQQHWPEIKSINLKVSKLNPPISGEVGKASVRLIWKKDL